MENNKRKPDENLETEQNPKEEKSKLSQLFTGDYEKFNEQNEKENKSFKNQQKEFSEFYKYLQGKYGDGLEEMIGENGKKRLEEITMDAIGNKKIKIGQNGVLSEEEKQLFKSSKSEKQAIQNSVSVLSREISSLPGNLDFQKFLDENNIEKKDNKVFLLKPNCKIQNAKDLKEKFFKFLQDNGVSLDNLKEHFPEKYERIKSICELFDRDQTEKVMITSTVRKVFEKVKQEGNTTQISQFQNDNIFKSWLNGTPSWNARPASEGGGRFELMYKKLMDFIHTNFDDEAKRKKLTNIDVSFNDLYKVGNDIGAWSGNQDGTNGKITDGNKQFYKTVKKVAPLYLTKNFINQAKYSAEKMTKAMKLFSPQITGLGDILKKYQEKATDKTGNFFGPNATKVGKRIGEISTELSKLKQEIDKQTEDDKIIELQQKIFKLEEEKSELEKQLTQGSEDERLRMEYIENFKKDDVELYEVLKKIKQNNFDFTKISKPDQNIISRYLIKEQLDNLDKENDLPIKVNKQQYKQFLIDVFDTTKEEATIYDKNGKPLKIKFSRDLNSQDGALLKGFMGNPIKNSISVSSFLEKNRFPFGVSIDLENSDPGVETFLYNSFIGFLGDSSPLWKFGGTIYSDNYKVKVKSKKGDLNETGYLSASPPFDVSEKDAQDESFLETIYIYDYPANLPLPKGKTRKILGAIRGPKDLENYDIDILKKDVLIDGDGIKGLTNSFLLAESMDELQTEEMEKITDELGDLKNSFKDTNEEKTSNPDFFDEKKEGTDKGLDSANKVWDSLDGFAGKNMEVGDEFVVNSGVKMKGPGYGYHHYALTISEIKSDKIILKIKGLHGNLGGTEGKTIEVPNSEAGMQKLQSFYKQKGGIWKFKKPSGDVKEFDDYVDKALEEGNFGDKEKQALEMLQKVSWKKGKFVDRVDNNKEMSFYINDQRTLSSTKLGQTVRLDIKNTGKGKFKISCEFLRKGDDDPKSKEKKDKIYKQPEEFETDYAGLIMFIKSKGDSIKVGEKDEVKNQIKQEKEIDKANGNTPKGETKFLSIGNMSEAFKGLFGGLKTWRTEDDEDLQYAFKDKLIGGANGLFGKLGRVPLIGEGFVDVHFKHQNDRDNMIYNKVQKYADREFSTDLHHSYVVDDRIVPLFKKLFQYKTTKDGDRVNIEWGNFDGNLNYKDRLKMIAAMMYMLKKEKGLYTRSLAPFAGQGIFLRAIFGDKLRKYYEYKKKELLQKSDKGDQQAQDAIATLELDIMIDSLRGGEHYIEDGHPNKIYNTILSRKLAGEIVNLKDGVTKEDSWQGEYEAKKKGSFSFALKEFRTFFGGNQIQKAMGVLLAMSETAQTTEEYNQVRMCATMFLLTKSYYFSTNNELKNLFDKKFRQLHFPLLMFHKDGNQNEIAKTSLDIATGGKFLKNSYFISSKLKEISGYDTRGKEARKFINEFESFWKGNKDDILEFLSMKNTNEEKNLITLAKNPEIKEYKGRKITKGDKNILNEVSKKYHEYSGEYIEGMDKVSKHSDTYDDILNTVSLRMGIEFGEKPSEEDKRERRDAYWAAMVKQTGNLADMGKLNEYTQGSVFDFYITKFEFVFAQQFGERHLKRFLNVIGKVQDMAKNPPAGYIPEIEGPRIVADYIRGQIYESNSERLPEEIRDPLLNYTEFICNNIHMFNNSVADSMGGAYDFRNASDFLVEGKYDTEYISASEWEKLTPEQKRDIQYKSEEEGKENINASIRKRNLNFTGKGKYGKDNAGKLIGETVDHMTVYGQKYEEKFLGKSKNIEEKNITDEQKEEGKKKEFKKVNPGGISVKNTDKAEELGNAIKNGDGGKAIKHDFKKDSSGDLVDNLKGGKTIPLNPKSKKVSDLTVEELDERMRRNYEKFAA